MSDDALVIRWARVPRLVVTALVIGLGIANLYWSVTDWSMSDAGAYWEAAHRLRAGGALYPSVADIEASNVYRYAPWFAWLAIPFTFLPLQAAGALWSIVLIASSVFAVVPLVQRGAWLLVAFFFPILIGISAVGNVHALMVAWLVWGVERRSGPLWIGLAASLKGSPMLLACVYIGRREWARAAAAFVLTALLVAPSLLFDLSGYVTSSGQGAALSVNPVLFALAVIACAVVTVRVAQTPFRWLAAAVAVVVATPRLFVYDVTYLASAIQPQLGADRTKAPGWRRARVISNRLPLQDR